MNTRFTRLEYTNEGLKLSDLYETDDEYKAVDYAIELFQFSKQQFADTHNESCADTFKKLEELSLEHLDNKTISYLMRHAFCYDIGDTEFAINRLATLLINASDLKMEAVARGLAYLTPQADLRYLGIITEYLERLNRTSPNNDYIASDYAEALFYLLENWIDKEGMMTSMSERLMSKLNALAKQYPDNEMVRGFAGGFGEHKEEEHDD